MPIDHTTRIYVAGCGGMLGEAVHGHFAPICQVRATDIDVNEPWLGYADVRDYVEMARHIDDFRPHVIVNLAAMTDLEDCERNIERAWATNALGAENLGLLATKFDATYVYVSTAGIFGGEKEFYTDYDTPNPLGCYARSKYYGECYVRQSVLKHFALRAGWMMGGGPRKDKKFVNKLYRQLAAGMRTLHVVDDRLGTPTYTVDFARGIHRLLESELYGLYNQVCGGGGSRYDVAIELVRLLGLEGRVSVERVSSDFFATEYFAARPASEQLVNAKLDARNLNVMRDWRVCLAEYVRTFPRIA
jgi:dTDP-4-dehydrorhamnose reductase